MPALLLAAGAELVESGLEVRNRLLPQPTLVAQDPETRVLLRRVEAPCSSIATARWSHRQRRAQGGPLLSLDVPIAGSRVPIGDTLTEDEGLAGWHGQDCCAAAMTELRHALQTALARLTAEDRRFCTALALRPDNALVAEGFGSRSALYRRLAELRHVLTAHGLGPAWVCRTFD